MLAKHLNSVRHNKSNTYTNHMARIEHKYQSARMPLEVEIGNSAGNAKQTHEFLNCSGLQHSSFLESTLLLIKGLCQFVEASSNRHNVDRSANCNGCESEPHGLLSSTLWTSIEIIICARVRSINSSRKAL